MGRRGEALAAEALRRHGFTIVAQNWYCREGEADLVAERDGELYFFEVRTRRGQTYGSPEQSVTPQKQARMEAVARRYLGEVTPDLDPAWHLGLAAVALDPQGRLLRLTLYSDLDGEPLPAL